MENFRSISLRGPLVESIESFIKNNPDFVKENPEYNSIAGFFDQAARLRLRELKKKTESK